MKALILAGGEGTRLRPLTLNTPKPIVPVVNVPFLRYQIELLRQHDIREIILSLAYQPHKIEAVLGDGSSFGVKLHYLVEHAPLGTAGAFKNAESLLDQATIVFNGDILCDLDLSQVIQLHRSHHATATLVLTRVENPSAYGLVETRSDGRITRFLEKPSADEITCNTINAGTYILEREVLQTIPAGQNFSFERGVFPSLLRDQRPVSAYVSEGYWIDIGTPQKYMQVHQDILQRRFNPSLRPNYAAELDKSDHLPEMGKSISVDENSIIGEGVDLGEGVKIRSSSIGHDCVVGKNVVVENSVIWPGVRIDESARLSGCIIGRDCHIEHHAIISRGVVLGDQSRVTAYSLLPD